jgi:hypothetical protein
MIKQRFSYDDIFNAIHAGSQLTTDEIVDLFDKEIDRFLVEEWRKYLNSAIDYDFVNDVDDKINWSADPKPELGMETLEELKARLGKEFDSWLSSQKARLNLTVGADIPYLLTELAGGERIRGEYVTQLVREIIQNKEKVTPDIQALRLEVMGLDGRLRTLERKVDDLSRR